MRHREGQGRCGLLPLLRSRCRKTAGREATTLAQKEVAQCLYADSGYALCLLWIELESKGPAAGAVRPFVLLMWTQRWRRTVSQTRRLKARWTHRVTLLRRLN